MRMEHLSIDVNQKTDHLFQRIAAETECRDVLCKILVHCLTPRTAAETTDFIISSTIGRTLLHPPQMLIAWLIEGCGLEARIISKGVINIWTSDIGKAVLELTSSSRRLRTLLSGETEYGTVFIGILGMCLEPKRLGEIEEALASTAVMQEQNILASYFISELENAGGLEWIGKWQTTPAGAEFISIRNGEEI